VILAVVAYTRLNGIDQSLWHDEVVSAASYSDTPAHVFTARYVPNNHMLFNLVASVSRRIIGPDEVALRLPSVLPALAGVCLGAWWAWRRYGRVAGVLSVALIGLSSTHLELARQARGYGLCFLATTGVVVFADEYAAGVGRRHLVAFTISGLIGTLTIPVFVVPYACAIAVLLALRCPWREVVVAGVAGALATVAWYVPVASDLLASRDQHYGTPLPWHSALTGPGGLVARDLQDQTTLVHLALLVTVVAAGVAAARRDRMATIAILVVPVCGTFTVLSALRYDVADRFISFLLVPVALTAAIGFSAAFAVRAVLVRVLLLAVIAVVLAASARGFRHEANRVARRPFEDFRGAAELVNATGIGTVVSNSARPDGLRFYLRPDLGLVARKGRLERFLCSADPPFVFIDHPFRSYEPRLRCLERDGASVHVFRQRGRGRRITVYVLRHRSPG
jgi:hypothetical protein